LKTSFGDRYPNLFLGLKGYGAFSYSHSQIDDVRRYIANQEAHHQKRTFREEYLDMLEKFGVDYDEAYVFDDLV